MGRAIVASAALALAVSTAACGAGEPRIQPAVLRDSAGFRIVDNAAPEWRPAERWRLHGPQLDVGVLEGDPAHQFHRVRGAIRLDDGRVVVANSGTQELRIFDRNGRLLRAVGREGEGPGEFRAVDGVWRYRGDSLIVADHRLNRLTVLTADGGYARSARIRTGSPIVQVRGVFPDGSVLSEEWPAQAPAAEGQPFETHLEYVRISPDGEPVESLGRFPRYLAVHRMQGGISMTGPALFGHWTHVAVFGNRFAVGTAKRSEIEIRGVGDAAGTRILVRWPDPVSAVTVADRERYREWRLRRADSEAARSRIRDEAGEWVFASSFRTHGQVQADPAGNVWVQRFREPWLEPEQASWMVFDSEGRFLGDVDIPTSLEVLDVGEDHLLGLWRDELGVERLRLYGVSKPAESRK